MKKFLSMIAVIILLLNMFSRFEATAYEKQDFYNVQIPIFQGNTEEISTELLNGITSDDKSKEGIIYISLEDFQRLSNAEVLRKSDDVVELKRNSVYLELRVNSEKAILSLAYAENAVEEWVQSLKCPILRIDGTKPVEENIDYIMEQIPVSYTHLTLPTKLEV